MSNPDPRDTQANDSVRAAAFQLIAQYGEDAEIIATLRAAEFAAQGDVQALADWDAIIDMIARIAADQSPTALN